MFVLSVWVVMCLKMEYFEDLDNDMSWLTQEPKIEEDGEILMLDISLLRRIYCVIM